MSIHSIFQIQQAVAVLEYMQEHCNDIVKDYQLDKDCIHSCGSFLLLTSLGIVEKSYVRTLGWGDGTETTCYVRPTPTAQFSEMVKRYNLDPDKLKLLKVKLFGE